MMKVLKLILLSWLFLSTIAQASTSSDIQTVIHSGTCDDVFSLINDSKPDEKLSDFMMLLTVKASICNGNLNPNTYGYGLLTLADIEKRSSQTGVNTEDINELRNKLLAIGNIREMPPADNLLSLEQNKKTEQTISTTVIVTFLVCFLLVLIISRNAFLGLIILVALYLFVSLIGAAATDMFNHAAFKWKLNDYDMFFVKGAIALLFALAIVLASIMSYWITSFLFMNKLIPFLESITDVFFSFLRKK